MAKRFGGHDEKKIYQRAQEIIDIVFPGRGKNINYNMAQMFTGRHDIPGEDGDSGKLLDICKRIARAEETMGVRFDEMQLRDKIVDDAMRMFFDDEGYDKGGQGKGRKR